jgi:PHD/YefM family antitoxin component YafN of YafNO toxin-antitoxin module
MQIIPANRTPDTLNDLLNRVSSEKEEFVFTENGAPVAALIHPDTLKKLEDYLDILAAEEALKEPGSVPWDQAKKELGL